MTDAFNVNSSNTLIEVLGLVGCLVCLHMGVTYFTRELVEFV